MLKKIHKIQNKAKNLKKKKKKGKENKKLSGFQKSNYY